MSATAPGASGWLRRASTTTSAAFAWTCDSIATAGSPRPNCALTANPVCDFSDPASATRRSRITTSGGTAPASRAMSKTPRSACQALMSNACSRSSSAWCACAIRTPRCNAAVEPAEKSVATTTRRTSPMLASLPTKSSPSQMVRRRTGYRSGRPTRWVDRHQAMQWRAVGRGGQACDGLLRYRARPPRGDGSAPCRPSRGARKVPHCGFVQ